MTGISFDAANDLYRGVVAAGTAPPVFAAFQRVPRNGA